MAKQISSLWVGLSGSVSGLAKGFGAAVAPAQSLVGSIGAVNAKLAGIGSGILKTAGLGAALKAGASVFDKIIGSPAAAIDAAREAAGAETKLGAVLRATGNAAGFSVDQLKAHAAELQASTTFDDDAIVAFQSVLATFRNVSGQAFTDATELALDMATVMGTDLQSAGVQLGKALNDPMKGITALTRVGVSFTAEQKAQIKAMQQAGDLAGAQGIILKELQGEFGGAAAAMAKTPFGRLTQMGNAFGDTMENLGAILADLLVGLADAFDVDSIIGSFTAGLASLQSTIKDWIPGAVASVKSFVGSAVSVFRSVYDFVAPIVTRTFEVVSNLFWRIVPVVQSVGASVWSAVLSAFQAVYNVVAPIVTTVYELIAANWQTILETTIEFGTAVWGTISGAFTLVLDIARTMWSGVVAVWNWGTGIVGATSLQTGSSATSAFTTIGNVLKWLAETATTAFTIAGYVMENWRDVGALAILTVEYEVVKFSNQVKYFFTEVIPAVVHWFADDWQNIIGDVFVWTNTVFANLADNIVNVIKNMPGLISGSVNFADLWTPLTEGFKRASKELVIPDRVAGDLETTLGAAKDQVGEQLGKGILDRLVAQQKSAEDAARSIGAAFSDAVKVDPFDAHAADDFFPTEIKTPTLTPKLDPQSLAVTIEPKLGKAVLAGSAESQALRFGALASAPVDRQKSTSDALAKNAEQQTTLQGKMVTALDKIADNSDDDEVVSL